MRTLWRFEWILTYFIPDEEVIGGIKIHFYSQETFLSIIQNILLHIFILQFIINKLHNIHQLCKMIRNSFYCLECLVGTAR